MLNCWQGMSCASEGHCRGKDDDDTTMTAAIMDTEVFHPVAGRHSCCSLLLAIPALVVLLSWLCVHHLT